MTLKKSLFIWMKVLGVSKREVQLATIAEARKKGWSKDKIATFYSYTFNMTKVEIYRMLNELEGSLKKQKT